MPHEIGQLKGFLREATDDEVTRRLAELKQEHFNLRVQQAVSALDNPKRIHLVRKQIARVQTELTRRRRAAGEQA